MVGSYRCHPIDVPMPVYDLQVHIVFVLLHTVAIIICILIPGSGGLRIALLPIAIAAYDVNSDASL